MEDAASRPKLCTRCKLNPRAVAQRWCQPCRTQAQRLARERQRQARLHALNEVKNATPAPSVCVAPMKNGSALVVGADCSAPSVEVEQRATAGDSNQVAGRCAPPQTLTPVTPVKNTSDHPYDRLIRQWASRRGVKVRVV